MSIIWMPQWINTTVPLTFWGFCTKREYLKRKKEGKYTIQAKTPQNSFTLKKAKKVESSTKYLSKSVQNTAEKTPLSQLCYSQFLKKPTRKP